MTVTILLLAAAGVLALWPDAEKHQPNPFLPPGEPAPGDWKTSVDALSRVRSRLSSTGMLDSETTQALDTLVGALVRGAGKP